MEFHTTKAQEKLLISSGGPPNQKKYQQPASGSHMEGRFSIKELTYHWRITGVSRYITPPPYQKWGLSRPLAHYVAIHFEAMSDVARAHLVNIGGPNLSCQFPSYLKCSQSQFYLQHGYAARITYISVYACHKRDPGT